MRTPLDALDLVTGQAPGGGRGAVKAIEGLMVAGTA
jgi:hypothetical protein